MTRETLLPESFLSQLRLALPDCTVLTDPADCWVYGYDNSKRQGLPGAVVFPTEHDDVVRLLRLCYRERIPVIARGRGTGTTGATVPTLPAVVVSFERMDQILRIDPANRVMVVQPGVTNQAVQDAAAQHGFFWPPDPSSAAYCTVGGNLAYNSAGPRAVKYGTPRENTLGLKAVTGTGDALHVGAYTTKSVVGYDLTRLIIGSEGTLALITEATLKLTPLPEAKRTLRAVYDSMHAAAEAVSAIMAQPATPCALEFMDAQALQLVREHTDLDLPDGAEALLMIEVDGPAAGMDQLTQQISTAAEQPGLLEVRAATSADQVQQLWQARKALSPLLRKIAPKKINEDVVVPVSQIPTLIDQLQALSQKYSLPIVNFGHAGNGNIHVNLLAQVEQLDQAHACLDEIFTLVLSLQGSLSGEHGVGLEKQNYIGRELDPVALSLMRQIKQQFDPANLLNPDKLFPLCSAKPE